MKLFAHFLILFCILSLQLQSQSWINHPYSNRINHIIEADGNLYIASNIGFFVANKSTKTVEHFHVDNSDIPSNEIERIAIDNQGKKWIGTYDAMLATLDDNNTWRTISYPDNLFDNVPGNTNPLFYALEFIGDDLYVASNKGLLKLSEGNWSLANIIDEEMLFRGVWSLAKNENKLFAGSTSVFELENNNWLEYDFSGQDFFSYSNCDIHYDKDYGILFFTDVSSVGVIKDGNLTEYASQTSGNYSFPISFSDVESISKDENGAIIATMKYGMAKFDGNTWAQIKTKDDVHETVDYYFIDKDQKHWYIINGVLYHEDGFSIDLLENSLENNYVSQLSIQNTKLMVNNGNLVNLADWSHFDLGKRVRYIDNYTDNKVCVAFIEEVRFYDDIYADEYTSFDVPDHDDDYGIRKVVAFAADDIYIQEYKGIYHYDGNQLQRIHFLNENKSYTSLVRDDEGNVWASFRDGGDCFGNNREQLQHFKDGALVKTTTLFDSCNKKSLKRASDGKIYRGSIGGEMKVYNATTEIWQNASFRGFIPTDGRLNDFDVIENRVIFNNDSEINYIEDGVLKNYNKENAPIKGYYTNLINFDGDDAWLAQSGYGLQVIKGLHQTQDTTTTDTNTVTNVLATMVNEISLYPNPTKGVLYFSESIQDITNIQIIDLSGRVIYSDNSNSTLRKIDVQHLNKGMYILSIKTRESKLLRRFLKN